MEYNEFKPLIKGGRTLVDEHELDIYFESQQSEWTQDETFQEYKFMTYYTKNCRSVLKLIADKRAELLRIEKDTYYFKCVKQY